jgi:hypothetical protein
VSAQAAKPKNRIERLIPKNGRFLVAMMVGAPADRARELRDKLAESRGILVQYHVEYAHGGGMRGGFKTIPKDVDLVLAVISQSSHALSEKAEKLARRVTTEEGRSIPTVRVSHKWTILCRNLYQRFRIGMCEPLPLHVTSTAYFRKPAEVEPDMPITEEMEAALAPPPPPEAFEPVGPSIAQIRAAEMELRHKFMRLDTLALIRELQARLPLAGMKSILISPTDVSYDTHPTTSPKAPTEPRAALSVVGEVASARIAGTVQ